MQLFLLDADFKGPKYFEISSAVGKTQKIESMTFPGKKDSRQQFGFQSLAHNKTFRISTMR